MLKCGSEVAGGGKPETPEVQRTHVQPSACIVGELGHAVSDSAIGTRVFGAASKDSSRLEPWPCFFVV